MTNDPYKTGQFKQNPYHAKLEMSARVSVVLTTTYDKRGLQLISQPSRCINRYQVHELIASDEADIKPGDTVDRIAYLGFVEFLTGGVLLAGDELWYQGRLIGTIAGFDETHMPNHYNIVVSAPTLDTGVDLGLTPGSLLTIRQAKAD